MATSTNVDMICMRATACLQRILSPGEMSRLGAIGREGRSWSRYIAVEDAGQQAPLDAHFHQWRPGGGEG